MTVDDTETPGFDQEVEHRDLSEPEARLDPRTVLWTSFRLFGIVGMGFVGFLVPVVFAESPSALPSLWVSLGSIALSVLAIPVLTATWIGLVGVSKIQWRAPSWSSDPIDLRRPLDFLHLFMWMAVAGSVGSLLAVPFAGFRALHPFVAMLVGMLAVWATIKYCMRQFGQRKEIAE